MIVTRHLCDAPPPHSLIFSTASKVTLVQCHNDLTIAGFNLNRQFPQGWDNKRIQWTVLRSKVKFQVGSSRNDLIPPVGSQLSHSHYEERHQKNVRGMRGLRTYATNHIGKYSEPKLISGLCFALTLYPFF